MVHHSGYVTVLQQWSLSTPTDPVYDPVFDVQTRPYKPEDLLIQKST